MILRSGRGFESEKQTFVSSISKIRVDTNIGSEADLSANKNNNIGIEAKPFGRQSGVSMRSQRMAATSGSGVISGAMRGKLRSFHPMAPRLSGSFDGPVGPTDGQDPSSSDKLSW